MAIETVTVTKSALDALRDERNEISRDYRKLANEAETLRRQRDEALQALRTISKTLRYSDVVQVETMIDELLAKYDAVTGVTQREDSDE